MSAIFEIGPTTAVQVVNFCLLLGVLKFVLFDPLKKAVNERQGKVKNLLDQADEVNREAKNLKDRYQDKLSRVDAEGKALYRKMVEQTETERNQRLGSLENELQALREKTGKELEAQQQKAFLALRKEVGELAIAATTRLLTGVLQPDTQQQLLRNLVKQMEQSNGD